MTTPRYTELADELNCMSNALALELPEVIHVDVAKRVRAAVAALCHAADLERAVVYNHGCYRCAEEVGMGEHASPQRAGLCNGHAADLEREVAELRKGCDELVDALADIDRLEGEVAELRERLAEAEEDADRLAHAWLNPHVYGLSPNDPGIANPALAAVLRLHYATIARRGDAVSPAAADQTGAET